MNPFKGLRLTARGEAVRDYLEGLACIACIALAVGAATAALKMIGY